MNEIVIDYYSKFEGEPEIQFILELNDERKILRIWEGYFDNIMIKIKPKPKGWIGLAYYYHLHIGWYDKSPWQIPELKVVIKQVLEINTLELDKTLKNILNDILKLLKEALAKKGKVFIIYD